VNTNHNKIVPIVIGGVAVIFAISMVLRFVLFSEYGIPTSYLLFGLPGAGIGLVVLLLRLGVFGGGQRSSGFVGNWQQNLGGQYPQPQHYPQPQQYPMAAPFIGTPAPQYPQAAVPMATRHLQELDGLLHAGAISQEDYAVRRQRIIATI
jgi:hypothetical protein